MTSTRSSVSPGGANLSKCKSVQSMLRIKVSIMSKSWSEVVFKCESLGISLTMSSEKVDSDRFNVLFSPLQGSYVLEQRYEKIGHCC